MFWNNDVKYYLSCNNIGFYELNLIHLYSIKITPLNHEEINILFFKIVTNEDKGAFKTLFYQFFTPLCVFAHRYVDDWETCQDIVQDVFARVWDKRRSIRIETSPRNFLVTCVRNNCIDYLRREDLQSLWISSELKKNSDDTPGDIYSVVELRELLEKALAKLPENVRTTFEKNRFDKKKYSEIADEMHISVKTVESHISKALKLLREELKDYLPIALLMLEIYK